MASCVVVHLTCEVSLDLSFLLPQDLDLINVLQVLIKVLEFKLKSKGDLLFFIVVH